jgi:catechol 2,3-dioxygenase-like lactoylglutathione lyase family enzyme
MRPVPIRYSADVAAAVRFYTALGLVRSNASRPGSWVEMVAPSGPSTGMVAIHGDPAVAGTCELAFEAHEPLEDVVARMCAAGYAPEPILDENFGRSVRVTDPDGVPVQLNEFDRELYT